MAYTLDQGERRQSRPAAWPRAAGGERAAPPSLWRRLFAPAVREPEASPWGAVVSAAAIAAGILQFHTAARSGYRLSASRQRALPRRLRTEDGWYEGETEWAAVAVVFDRIFERLPAAADHDAETLYHAGKEILRNWRPEEYEHWFQTSLEPHEIESLAITQFHREHARRWIVIDAFDDRWSFVVAGCLHVRAKWGGDPPHGASRGHAPGPSRWFIVDAGEFTHARGRPFVIDPERHHEIDEPAHAFALAH